MNKLTNKIKVPIDKLKETSWSTIIVFSILYCVYVTFINLVVFKSGILKPITDLTSGLINRALVANIASIIIFVFIIIIKYGKLRFFDIGIKKNRLFSAVAAIAIIWVSMQLINIIYSTIVLGEPVIYGGWNEYGVTRMFGSIIGQLFGNSLFEEIVFRGFLLVQICKKLKNKKGSLLFGIVLSQVLFAIIHIPSRLLSGMDILEILPSLIIVFLIGIFFVVIYLLTDNIFLVVGIHSLWNTPLLVFEGIPSMLFIFVATIILLIIWNKTLGKLDFKNNDVSDNLNY